jgi:hypothetical protein
MLFRITGHAFLAPNGTLNRVHNSVDVLRTEPSLMPLLFTLAMHVFSSACSILYFVHVDRGIVVGAGRFHFFSRHKSKSMVVWLQEKDCERHRVCGPERYVPVYYASVSFYGQNGSA